MAIKSIEYRIKEFCENYTMEGLAVVCVKLEDEIVEIENEYFSKCEELESQNNSQEKVIEELKAQIAAHDTEVAIKKLAESMKRTPVQASVIEEISAPQLKCLDTCVKINQLQTAIDVLIDKIANLREYTGL